MANDIIAVMRRYELKYVLSADQVRYFMDAVKSHMKIDRYGLTTIASLYFDTPDFRMINRSIEKPFYKEKLRLRSYGLAKGDSPVFLEIKRKDDHIVYKRRIATTEIAAGRFVETKERFDGGQISRELQAFKEHYGALEPKYLILYDRIAYCQDDSDVRITLDMNPRYRVDELNLHTSLEGTPLLNEGEAILEVKVQHSIPLWLSEILTKGKIYLSSFSKVGAAHKKEMGQRNVRPLPIPQPIPVKEGGHSYGFTI